MKGCISKGRWAVDVAFETVGEAIALGLTFLL